MRPVIAAAAWAALAGTGAAQHGTLTFDKLAAMPRPAEPVVLGIPFPRDVLRDAGRFGVWDGARALPVQARVTGTWPDGSVRWLFVRALADLPANRSVVLEWRIGDAAPADGGVRVAKLPDGSLEVDTGVLAARVPAAGFLPLADVRLNGRPAGPEGSRMMGFTLRAGGKEYSTAAAGPVKLEVVEPGPLAAVIRVSGRHGGADSPFDFSALLTFWKGKPYVEVEYRVLGMRGGPQTEVESWTWAGEGQPARPRLRVLAGGKVSSDPARAGYTFAPQGPQPKIDFRVQSFWGDFWGDWTGDTGGLAATVRHAQQNFPKAVEAAAGRLLVSLYPAGQPPLRFPFGAAKTHRMLLHFHAPDTPVEEISARSLQFQLPDVPHLEPSWYGRCGVWDERVFDGPRSRRVESVLYDVLDDRPVGVGLWNFGDEAQWGYTGQGRGGGDVVWLNNEYDLAHLLFVTYARTGQRRFFDYAAANALHWRDVDIAHAASDRARLGGHIMHSAAHVTGGVTPSHQWVEGLLDAWHIQGDRDAYDAAIGIGDNILRLMDSPKFRNPATAHTREMGWALRAMLALYRETRAEKYAAGCREIVALFKRWNEQYPGLLMPGGSGVLIRVNFMNSLTLASLARYEREFPDESLRRMIVAVADDMVRATRTPHGVFEYLDFPSMRYQDGTAIVLEALAEAYRLTGDLRYIESGVPHLDYALGKLQARNHAAGKAPIGNPYIVGGNTPGGKTMGTSLMPMLQFIHAAADTDLAAQFDGVVRLRKVPQRVSGGHASAQ